MTGRLLKKLDNDELENLKSLLIKFRATLDECSPEVQLEFFLLAKDVMTSMGYIVSVDPKRQLQPPDTKWTAKKNEK